MSNLVRNLVLSMKSEEERLRAAIAATKPELLDEFKSLRTASFFHVAVWLDKHFPLPDGRKWGTLPIDGSGERIRQLYRTADRQ